MQENISPTQSSERKTSIGARFPLTTPSCLSLSCGEVGSDVHALIKELAIRQVEHRSEIHSNESQAEGTEVRLRRRFYFVLQQVLLLHKRHYLSRQGVALAGTPQLCSQDPVSVHAHCTEGVTGSEGHKGANGVRGRNEDVNGDEEGDRAGTRTEVEASERTQDGNGDGSEDGAGTGTGVETRGRTQDGNENGSWDVNDGSSGDGNRDGNGNEDGMGEGEGETKKRKKYKNCRRDVGNGKYLCGKKEKT